MSVANCAGIWDMDAQRCAEHDKLQTAYTHGLYFPLHHGSHFATSTWWLVCLTVCSTTVETYTHRGRATMPTFMYRLGLIQLVDESKLDPGASSPVNWLVFSIRHIQISTEESCLVPSQEDQQAPAETQPFCRLRCNTSGALWNLESDSCWHLCIYSSNGIHLPPPIVVCSSKRQSQRASPANK